MIPLQGTNTYLQGGTGYLQGSSPNLQQGVNPTQPQQPAPLVKPAAPQATAPTSAQQKYINDLSGTYGLSGGTVYNKSTNTGLTLDQFKSATGIQNPDWNSLKFDTNYKPMSFNSPAAQQYIGGQLGNSGDSRPAGPSVSAPKSAYLEYLRNQFNPQALESAQGSLNELNKRTSEELLRARAREDELRANKIGQVESGLNYGLNENARLSNKSLADLALAKGYQTENYNRLLGYGSSLYNLENLQQDRAGTMLQNTAPALLAEFENLGDKTRQDAYVRAKAQELGVSIDQVNSALQAAIASKQAAQAKNYMSVSEGEAVWDPVTGEFIFKNPKTYSPNEGGAGGLTPYQLLSYNNTIQDNMRQDPAIKAFGELVNAGVPQVIQSTLSNPQSISDTLLMRTLAKVTDPTTGVREEEYRTFENAQGALNRLYTLPSHWLGRGRLTEQGRAAMLQEIQNRYNSLQTNYNSAYQYYNGQIGQVGGTPPPLYQNNSGGGGNPDDFINQVLGFKQAGNASASTPYLSTLGAVTGLNGSPLWKWGLDIDLKVGQPVKTPVGGQVIAVAPNGGFGNQVKIRAADGTEYWFSHLQKGTVKVGQTIPRGTIIGLGGNSGNTIPGKGGDGSHLDLTAKDRNGKYIPPSKIAAMLKQIYV